MMTKTKIFDLLNGVMAGEWGCERQVKVQKELLTNVWIALPVDGDEPATVYVHHVDQTAREHYPSLMFAVYPDLGVADLLEVETGESLEVVIKAVDYRPKAKIVHLDGAKPVYDSPDMVASNQAEAEMEALAWLEERI